MPSPFFCEFESRSGDVYYIKHYVMKFVSALRQVGDFLHQWNWQPQYNWNIVESGVKHHEPNQTSPLLWFPQNILLQFSIYFVVFPTRNTNHSKFISVPINSALIVIFWLLILMSVDLCKKWANEWLLLNTSSAIVHLYHGQNKLIFNEMMTRFAIY